MSLRSEIFVRHRQRETEIENQVRELQVELWRNRTKIWKSEPPSCPLAALDPGVALSFLGFKVELDDSLGQIIVNGVKGSIAGTIHQELKEVRISRRLPYVAQRFTAAHELGHAVMHSHLRVLHRDLPVEGVSQVADQVEVEANRFASFFFMPKKIVEAEFQRRFGLRKLVLSDRTAFRLCQTGLDRVKANVRSLRAFSRLVAQATSYGGRSFESMAGTFTVSVAAMAIRLEELDLVQF